MLHLSPKYDDDHFVKHRHHCNCNLFSVGTTFEERDKKWNSKLFRNCKGATFGLFIFYFWSIWNGCDDTPPGIELDYLLAILLLSNFLCCPLCRWACQETVTTCHLTMHCSAQRVHYPLVWQRSCFIAMHCLHWHTQCTVCQERCRAENVARHPHNTR